MVIIFPAPGEDPADVARTLLELAGDEREQRRRVATVSGGFLVDDDLAYAYGIREPNDPQDNPQSVDNKPSKRTPPALPKTRKE